MRVVFYKKVLQEELECTSERMNVWMPILMSKRLT